MKIKKILAAFVALVLCFALSACTARPTTAVPDSTQNETTSSTGAGTVTTTAPSVTPTPDKTPTGSTPLLYKVTDADGDVVWLLGSIHAGQDSFYPLPDYVLNAFNSADALAVEFDIVAFENDMSAQMDAMMQLIYVDGTSIRDHVDEKIYDDAVKILKENNTYMSALDLYIPSMWSSFIDSLTLEKIGAKLDLGVDRHLIDLAYKKQKPVLDVESAKLQYGVMAEYSPALQEALLESSIEGYRKAEENKAQLEEMMNTWQHGNEDEMTDMVKEDVIFENDEDKRLYEEYNNAMVVERNLAMTDYAENALRSGKEVFICVGAVHVVGDGAIAQLLESRGYTVEIVH